MTTYIINYNDIKFAKNYDIYYPLSSYHSFIFISIIILYHIIASPKVIKYKLLHEVEGYFKHSELCVHAG